MWPQLQCKVVINCSLSKSSLKTHYKKALIECSLKKNAILTVLVTNWIEVKKKKKKGPEVPKLQTFLIQDKFTFKNSSSLTIHPVAPCSRLLRVEPGSVKCTPYFTSTYFPGAAEVCQLFDICRFVLPVQKWKRSVDSWVRFPCLRAQPVPVASLLCALSQKACNLIPGCAAPDLAADHPRRHKATLP